MNKITLIGSGGHFSSIEEIIINCGFTIEGYVDKNKNENINYKYLGNDLFFLEKINEPINVHIALGYMGEKNNIRKNIFNTYKKKCNFPTIVSPNSMIASQTNIGFGSIIMNDVLIQPRVSIVKNTIVNNKVLIEHGSSVGDHCHISTGVIVNGDVSIGNNVFIGSGTIIKNNVKINDDVVIGMGSLVLNDINKSGLYYGKI